MSVPKRSTISRLDVSEFVFPDDEPWPGQTGVVVAYVVRHPDAILLFDTGIGFGSPVLDDRYRARPRRIDDVLAEQSLQVGDIDIVVNCHLHADHAGQNAAFQGVPIYVQPTEWQASRDAHYTVLDWIERPGLEYRQVPGDHEILPGIRVIATPGHSPGHQSLIVEAEEGPTILVGQALYSAGEWSGVPDAREGRTSARDRAAYDSSVEKLRRLEPARIWFGHDRASWSPGTEA